MTKLTQADLVEEVLNNARKDRIRLERVADALLTVSDEDTEEAGQKIAAAAASAAVSEELSKVTDSLTKINQQLVEIVKHQRKTSQVDEDRDLSSKDKDDVYEKLEKERGKRTSNERIQ